MARRATVLTAERAASPQLLLLEAGNSLFGQQVADDSQGRIPIAAMNLMGYSAMTLGQAELQAGAAVLRERASEARFPFLGANLPAGLPAKPYVLVNVGGRDVAVLGLTNAETPLIPAVGGAIAVGDPLEAARRYVPALRQQTTIVIVLSNLGKEMDQRLAREVPGITAIIGGHDREFLQPPCWRDRSSSPRQGSMARLWVCSGWTSTHRAASRLPRARYVTCAAMSQMTRPCGPSSARPSCRPATRIIEGQRLAGMLARDR